MGTTHPNKDREELLAFLPDTSKGKAVYARLIKDYTRHTMTVSSFIHAGIKSGSVNELSVTQHSRDLESRSLHEFKSLARAGSVNRLLALIDHLLRRVYARLNALQKYSLENNEGMAKTQLGNTCEILMTLHEVVLAAVASTNAQDKGFQDLLHIFY